MSASPAILEAPAVPDPPTLDRPHVEILDLDGGQPLPSPRRIRSELPLTPARARVVAHGRQAVRDVLHGPGDDRLIAVVGPCSIHDPIAVAEYARLLRAAADRHCGELVVVMRAYFEKPRTTVGWKGLVNDPGMDGSHDLPRGLRLARRTLLDILDIGLPVACEFLEPLSAQYLADAVSWGAIGARTPESQVHRQLVSGLGLPVGFKNGSDGDLRGALDGCLAAASGHAYLGMDIDGQAAVVRTRGNPDCHLVLRGGRSGPNCDQASVTAALAASRKAGLSGQLVVDASHGNSAKDHHRQAEVTRELAAQIASGQRGIGGVMLESFLVAGRQEPEAQPLVYGMSVTDACMDWGTTEGLLAGLAAAVRDRRAGA